MLALGRCAEYQPGQGVLVTGCNEELGPFAVIAGGLPKAGPLVERRDGPAVLAFGEDRVAEHADHAKCADREGLSRDRFSSRKIKGASVQRYWKRPPVLRLIHWPSRNRAASCPRGPSRRLGPTDRKLVAGPMAHCRPLIVLPPTSIKIVRAAHCPFWIRSSALACLPVACHERSLPPAPYITNCEIGKNRTRKMPDWSKIVQKCAKISAAEGGSLLGAGGRDFIRNLLGR